MRNFILSIIIAMSILIGFGSCSMGIYDDNPDYATILTYGTPIYYNGYIRYYYFQGNYYRHYHHSYRPYFKRSYRAPHYHKPTYRPRPYVRPRPNRHFRGKRK